MSVSIKDVEYVAKLARLEFEDKDMGKFTNDFNNILDFVEKLSQIDTEKINESINPYPVYNELREDKEVQSMDRKLLLENAPKEEYGFFVVPKMID